MGYYGARPLHDIRRGAVVPFQLNDSHRGKIPMEIADNLDVRTTPTVNALVVVAHNRHVLLLVNEQLQKFILHVVGILIFIYHHVLVAFRQLVCQAGYFLEHEHRIEQQVIKVHGVGFLEALLVFPVKSCHSLLVGKFRAHHGDFRRLQNSFAVGI